MTTYLEPAAHTAHQGPATTLAARHRISLDVVTILAFFAALIAAAILIAIVTDVGAAGFVVALAIWLFAIWRAHEEHNKHGPRARW